MTASWLIVKVNEIRPNLMEELYRQHMNGIVHDVVVVCVDVSHG